MTKRPHTALLAATMLSSLPLSIPAFAQSTGAADSGQSAAQGAGGLANRGIEFIRPERHGSGNPRTSLQLIVPERHDAGNPRTRLEVIAPQPHNAAPASVDSPATITGQPQTLTVMRDLPVGENVVYGSVGFDRSSPDSLIVNQSSDRAIVNWQSFDIAAGKAVDVNQPGAAARALFRVTGDTDSRIAGTLTANGQLYLINPNGIAVGAGARINTQSLVASTLDIADADFLSGNFTFRKDGQARGIYNGGNISANGDIALLGGSVVNEGVVSAKLGRIGYGAGDAITLDFAGDRFLSIAVPVSDAKGLKDVFGRELSALITAGGTTEAQGGRIYLSARAARDLMIGAVRIEGSLIANSFRQDANGTISLGAITVEGGDGLVQNEGLLDVSGGDGMTGGRVQISGGAVGLGGVVNASGDRGGGTVDVKASNILALAGTVDASAPRGDGGTISYRSAGGITENVHGLTNVSGGLSGGMISMIAEGKVETSGTYLAEGLLGMGGHIDITGSSVKLLSTQIAARGLKQGGLVRVGGAFQGGAADRISRADYQRFEGRFGALPSLANAATTFINDGVAINVSSSRGTGGGAIIWADDQTTMLGSLSATGVRAGGTSEISGKNELRYVDLSTINTGVGGELLLDPSFITIGDFEAASSWQYAAIIGSGLTTSVPGVTALESGDQFGGSVSLNAAGDRLAVGATGDDGFGNIVNGSGAVRLFSFADGNFGGGALVGTIGRGYVGAGNIDLGAALELGDAFGQSVSLNAAGDRLAVGTPTDDGFGNIASLSGSVRLFSFADGNFGGGTLTGTIGRGYVGAGNIDLGAALAVGDRFGQSVSLNAAGDRLAVGAQTDDGFGNIAVNAGSVRLFSFADGNFGGGALTGTIGRGYVGTGNIDLGAALDASDLFGVSVSLNATGDRLAVGADGDDGFGDLSFAPGSVRLFSFADGNFGGGTLTGTIGRGYVGAGNIDLGAALAFNDRFGQSVSLNAAGDRLAVGAPNDDGFGNIAVNAGSVRLFSFADGNFGGGALTGTIGRGYVGTGNIDLGAALEVGDAFGQSVSLNAAGDRLAVGAPTDDGFGNIANLSGSVRLFSFADGNFGGGILTGTIGRGYRAPANINLGAALESGDEFGRSVALNAAGDRLAVGASFDDDFGNIANLVGSVRLFSFADGNFSGGTLTGTIGRGNVGTGNIDLGAALDAGDQFGGSVSLNAAGDRLAVGATGDDGFGNIVNASGAVRLFSFADGNFGGGTLTGIIGRGYVGASDIDLGAALEANDVLGISVALNAAGDRLAVGATGDDGFANDTNDSGSVRLFSFADGNFGGGTLTGTIGRGYVGTGDIDLGAALDASDLFGLSVSLNAAGDRLAVGAPLDRGFGDLNFASGSVRLFSFADGNFGGGTLSGTIGRGYVGAGNIDLGAALDAGDQFGRSVALNAAGDRLAVGAFFDDGFGNIANAPGAVRLFSFADGNFGGGTLSGTIGLGYTGIGDIDLGTALSNLGQFGSSVALNAAGDRLAVGAPTDDGFGNIAVNAGSVRLFSFADGNFGGGALVGTIGRGYRAPANIDLGAALESDLFGQSVALNAAGDRLAVGAYFDNGFGNIAFASGAVRLFSFNHGNFSGGTLTGTIGRGYVGAGNIDLGVALETGDRFGHSVSLNAAGDRLAVGAQFDRGFGNITSSGGAVRLFSFADGNFGGGTLTGTIGRGYVGTGDIDLGAALEIGDLFGTSVALNGAGDRLAVGATRDDGFGNIADGSGSVRLFSFTDGNFGGGTLTGTIGRGYVGTGNIDLGAALDAFDQLGTSVALNAAGDRLAVGASSDDGFGDIAGDSGSVRLFSFADGNFGGGTLTGTIGRGYAGAGDINFGAALEGNDQFGVSVSLNATGDRLVVGADGDDGFGNIAAGSGAVRLFSFADGNFSGGTLTGTIGRGYVGTGNIDLGAALETGDRFGTSVALNAAGDRLAVGAPSDDGFGNIANGSGSVRLFSFADRNFGGGMLTGTIGRGYVGGINNIDLEGPRDIDLGAALEAFDQFGVADQFGVSVSLNATGDRLAVGADGDDGFGNIARDSGSVRLFSFADGNFGGGTLTGTIGRGYVGTGNIDLGAALEAFDAFGTSVALNAAGDRLAVGAPSDDGLNNIDFGNGSVRLFSFADGSFGGGTLTGTIGRGYAGAGDIDLGAGLEATDFLGFSVALNAAGDRLAVGATGDDGSATQSNNLMGSVRLFSFADGNFGGGMLTGTIGLGYAGTSDIDVGVALDANDQFGRSVSLNAAGDRLAVGANRDRGFGNIASTIGSVRLFSFADGNFGGGTLIGTIGRGYAGAGDIDLGAALEGGDQFGQSVALNAAGDRLAVGANRDAGLGNIAGGSGSVRLFSFADGNFGGGTLTGTIGRGYAGRSDFDTSGGPLQTIGSVGSALAFNADASSLVLGGGNAVVALRRTASGPFGNLLFADDATGMSNIAVSELQTALSTGQSISFEASNDIILQSNLTVNNLGGNGGALNLRAGRSILLNGSIVTDDGDLSLIANSGGSDLATVNANRLAGAASIIMAAGTSINAGTGAVSIALTDGAGLTIPTSGDISLGNITAGSIQVSNAGPTAGSDIILQAGTALTASAMGRAIDIRALTGTFTNNAGNGALALTGGGTFGIFSDAPATTTEGVINYLKRYNVADAATFGALDPGGNFFAYRIAPILTVTTNDLSRFYGDANPAFTFGIAGFIDGDTAAGSLTGAPVLTSLANLTSGVGGYAINPALGTLVSVEGYQFNFAAGNLMVVQRPITVTADALSRIYGNANPALTFTTGGMGLVNGDTLTGALATTAGLTSNVGTYGITQGTLDAGGNYALTYNGANLSVTQRGLTVTADALSRIYGNANPALTFTTGGMGLVNGDTLSGALATTAGLTSNVGTYGITQGTLDAGGNYALTYNGANLSVTQRGLTVTADALSRIYGNANPALTFTTGGMGLVNGDTLSGALATAAGLTSNVGTYAITQGTLDAGGNYALTYNGANLSVTQRGLTVTADALSRIYGNANPALTFTTGGMGLVNGDTLTGALATTAGLTSNVGNYAITQGTLDAGGNYALTYNGANLSVTQRGLTVTADALSRIYGNANPALTFTTGGMGLVNGDTLTGALATTAGLTSNVGTYGITQGTLDAGGNYALTYNGANLSVTQRGLTVTADALSRIYGNANPALTFTTGGMGLVNGDTLSGALATAAGLTSNVGNYAITQGTLDAGGNYALTYNGANLSVTQRGLTVTADALSRIYGNANPALTFTTGGMGLVNGDTLTGALATTAGLTSNVGTYGITQGTLDAGGNYALTYNGANLSVTQRGLTVTADALSRIYGNANPALTFTTGGMGLVNGDTLTGALATTAGLTSNVGNYAITQGTLDAGGNYALTYNGANLSVTQRGLTVTADALSRIYGNANPALTFTTGGMGLVNGDTLSGALATTAGLTSNVGNYAITQGTLSAGSNYVLTYNGANLSVTQRGLTVTADALSRIYGNANPALTFTTGGMGLVNGDTLTGALATTAGLTSNVGAYGITQGSLSAGGNYALTYNGANLSVLQRPITVTADSLSKIFGTLDPIFTYRIGGLGLVNGDVLPGALSRDAGENTGFYTIRQGTLFDNNYQIQFVPGTFVINFASTGSSLSLSTNDTPGEAGITQSASPLDSVSEGSNAEINKDGQDCPNVRDGVCVSGVGS